MKLGKYELRLNRETPVGHSLAATSSATPKVDAKGLEKGGSGVPYQGYFPNESRLGRVREPSVKQLMDMIDEDGTAAAVYALLQYPIISTDTRIVPDKADELEVDGNTTHPQADFIDQSLNAPLHKGGMSTPFSLIMAEMVLGVVQGHRFFEIVYKINDQGLYAFQKIVGREVDSYKIETDSTGGFDGVSQVVTKDGKQVTVRIELPYSLLYTFRKERDKLKGKSAFRAMFYHYDKKHRLYYLFNQQGQQSAVNPKLLRAPSNAKDSVIQQNLRAVDMMAVRPAISLPFGWTLEILKPSQAMNLLPGIDHHDAQMARSVLAQMIMLGTQSEGKGGSFALSDNHTDLFMLGEVAIMKTIEEHVNAYLIPKLIDLNFEQRLYPEFKFNDMNDDTIVLMQEGFKSLVAKGAVPKWVANGISEGIAEKLKIDRPEGDEADIDNDYIGITSSPTNPSLSREAEFKKKRASRLAKTAWWRELTAAEAKVNFSKIEKLTDANEQQLLDELKPIFTDIADDTVARLEPLLEDKAANGLDGFELDGTDRMATALYDNMLSTYTEAKKQAADEIKKAAPANKQQSKDLIKQHTQAIIDKQSSELLFNLKTIVTDAVRKNLLAKTQLSLADVLKQIADMFNGYFDEKEPLTAAALVSTAINIGRDDIFQAFSEKIYGYQYSAILDDKVCPICLDLDGSLVDEDTYHDTIWMPPIHFNCVSADDIVDAPDALEFMRTEYVGKMVKVSLSDGRSLTVSPNHPVLTRRGFVAANMLDKTDQVVSSSHSKGILPANPDKQDVVSSVSNLFDSLSKTSGVSTRSMPVATKDFHNDGEFCQGNVDVIDMHSLLSSKTDIKLTQKVAEKFFNATDPGGRVILPSDSDLLTRLYGLALASDGIVSSNSISSILLDSSSAHHELIRRALVSNYDARISKSASNNIPRDIEALTDSKLGLSELITFDDIVDVELIDYVGHVYDFSTMSTVYSVNGVITSNCRCIWVAIMDDETEKPPFKDIPDSPGGTDAPTLSRTAKIHEHNLSAVQYDYAIYLNKQAGALWRQIRTA